MQEIVKNIIIILCQDYFQHWEIVITSNRESNYGRYVIALEPKDKRNYGLIFEFKVRNENSIEEKVKEALAQIDEKNIIYL